jgi:hypothetical protein
MEPNFTVAFRCTMLFCREKDLVGMYSETAMHRKTKTKILANMIGGKILRTNREFNYTRRGGIMWMA